MCYNLGGTFMTYRSVMYTSENVQKVYQIKTEHL